MNIIKLRENPEMKEEMAQWFHEKWGIPLEAYLESMEECFEKKAGVPQWYVAIEDGQIVGGLIFTTERILPPMCVQSMLKKHIDARVLPDSF